MTPAILLLLAPPQSAPAPIDDIVGYEYHCSAEVKAADGTVIAGTLAVDGEGRLAEFSASARPQRTKLDQAFFIRDFRGFESVAAVASWSLRWRVDRTGLGPTDLAFDAARIEIDINRRKTLPRTVAGALSRDWSEYTALIGFAERWPGRKSGAALDFPLAELLGFASGRSELNWRLLRTPVRGVAAGNDALASGQLALGPIRAARSSFDAFKARLLADAAGYRTRCKREPVRYDPNGEI